MPPLSLCWIASHLLIHPLPFLLLLWAILPQIRLMMSLPLLMIRFTLIFHLLLNRLRLLLTLITMIYLTLIFLQVPFLTTL
jgi:hypothetical protein